MKRARLNLLIDAVVGVAFLVTAVTGVAFLLPPAWQQALLVGLTFHSWHWLHDWSGVVATAGVALHLALHWRWVVHTASRWLAEARSELPDRRASAARSAGSAGAAAQATAPTSDDAPARLLQQARGRDARSRGRLTRRGLLVGAAGFGAALVGGVALSRIAEAVGNDQATTAAGSSSGQAGSGTTSSSSAATGSSSGTAGSSSSGTAGASGTSTARVVVD
jgi:hypothetical protein